MKKINILARRTAKAMCTGFILHDKKEYTKGAKQFAIVFKNLFNLNKINSEKAGKYYMDFFSLHDIAEDYFKGTSVEIFNHSIWKKIYNTAIKLCNLCDISHDYAKNYVMFLRYHTAYPKNKKRFIMYLLASERAFISSLVTDKKFQTNLAPLYLAGVGGHDAHTNRWWKFTEDVMTLYYEMIFEKLLGVKNV